MEAGEKIKVKIWDTAGQKRLESISLNSLKISLAAILVFDLAKKLSFDRIIKWIKEIREYSTRLPIGLFGNKSDLDEREVNAQEINNLCKSENLIYYEISKKIIMVLKKYLQN